MPSTHREHANDEEYEKFGLYPFSFLQKIVSGLASSNYTNPEGQQLVNSDEFQQLEQMAYEPPVPDPETQTVAGLINSLEVRGYANSHGESLKSHPVLQILKLLNIRKSFRRQPEEISQLLNLLEGGGFQVSTQTGVLVLKHDPAFGSLRQILSSTGDPNQK